MKKTRARKRARFNGQFQRREPPVAAPGDTPQPSADSLFVLPWKSMANRSMTMTTTGTTRTLVPPQVQGKPHCLSGPPLLSCPQQRFAPHSISVPRIRRLGVRRNQPVPRVARLCTAASRQRLVSETRDGAIHQRLAGEWSWAAAFFASKTGDGRCCSRHGRGRESRACCCMQRRTTVRWREREQRKR